LGQQGGNTKFPCFLCEWDSRAGDKHWTTKEWSKRENLTPGTKNVIHASLVDPQKVLLPLLHIKLGIMKQFVKALDKSGSCFQYLGHKFAALSEVKVKEGMFDGPQIRQLMKDTAFTDTMSDIELQAWNAFKKFLGNVKDPRYEKIVGNVLEKLQILGCNISLKLHFLHFHLDFLLTKKTLMFRTYTPSILFRYRYMRNIYSSGANIMRGHDLSSTLFHYIFHRNTLRTFSVSISSSL
jgi:hypothetical protein